MAPGFIPCGNGGLGVRSAQMLAPSAFLASAASTLHLQQAILPPSIRALEDKAIVSAETTWAAVSAASKPAREAQHIQKV